MTTTREATGDKHARGLGRPAPEDGPRFWLVLDGHGLAPPLTVPLATTAGAEKEALAVFSDEGEAVAFCGLRDGGGLLLCETTAREIVSLLRSRWFPTRLVALDPVPASRGLTDLLTLDREPFARRFLRRTSRGRRV